jgi:hypothetical protein
MGWKLRFISELFRDGSGGRGGVERVRKKSTKPDFAL